MINWIGLQQNIYIIFIFLLADFDFFLNLWRLFDMKTSAPCVLVLIWSRSRATVKMENLKTFRKFLNLDICSILWLFWDLIIFVINALFRLISKLSQKHSQTNHNNGKNRLVLGMLPFYNIVNHFSSSKKLWSFSTHCISSERLLSNRINRQNEFQRASFPQRAAGVQVLLVTILLWSSLEVRCLSASLHSRPRTKRKSQQWPTTTMMTGKEPGQRVTGQHCCARPGLVLRVAESTGAALEGGRAVALGYWQAGGAGQLEQRRSRPEQGGAVVASGALARSLYLSALVSHAILTSGDLWPWLAGL